MNKLGPIVLIDDDEDDTLLMREVIRDLNIKNDLVSFSNGAQAIEFLSEAHTQPFLILSDLYMPVMTGYETRKAIFANQQIREKCIPYIFLTTASDPTTIFESYQQSIQGFFTKPTSYEALKKLMDGIINYWTHAVYPY